MSSYEACLFYAVELAPSPALPRERGRVWVGDVFGVGSTAWRSEFTQPITINHPKELT